MFQLGFQLRRFPQFHSDQTVRCVAAEIYNEMLERFNRPLQVGVAVGRKRPRDRGRGTLEAEEGSAGLRGGTRLEEDEN